MISALEHSTEEIITRSLDQVISPKLKIGMWMFKGTTD